VATLIPLAVSQAATNLANQLMEKRQAERDRLERLLHYRQHGVEPFGVLSDARIMGMPAGVPDEVRILAKKARVNLLKYVVASRVQDLYVDGYKTSTNPENVPGWDVWQANQLDARQIGVHRAALTFGASFVVTLPGKPVPVVRGVSPREMTVGYGDDDVWPVAALWKLRGGNWRLLDNTYVWTLKGADNGQLSIVRGAPHGAVDIDGVTPICPVVRFRETVDLDCDVEGIISPLTELQDQVNITSFGLQVAQHYGAFRQRYIMGWLADTEAQALKTGASRLMMFEDSPQDIQVGEFAQTELRGYIESREASIRHLATVSQTPVHELMGQFVNLSAEALEAARQSHTAATEENRLAIGESWEQVLALSSRLNGTPVEASASVVWRDTSMRSMLSTAQALGTLAEKLGVPPKALWSRIPGVSQHELDQWKALSDEPGAFDDLMMLMTKQTAKVDAPVPGEPPIPAPAGV
jgi:hypothetical protein